MHEPGPTGSERAPLLWLILPVIGGIILADLGGLVLPRAFWFLTLAIGTALTFATWRNHPAWWRAGIIISGIALGSLHCSYHRQQLPGWAELPDREVELVVSVDRVFESAYSHRSFSFGGHVQAAAAPSAELEGQTVHVQLRRPADPTAILARGASLQVIGQLTRLDPHQSEGFELFLADSGYGFRVRQARWLATTEPPSAYARTRDTLKDRAGEILARGLADHPTLVGAMQAMLLGQRHELSANAKSLFMRSGTMHLFAISGLHIGVIAAALHGLLRVARLSRPAAFFVGTALLWGYVDLIGQTPSAVRAWLMITCFLGSRICRAPGNPVAAIATSALLVLLLDPLQLFSAGFQMSYAIVFALLLHGIPVGEHWQTLIRPWRDLPLASLAPWQRWIQTRTEVMLMAAAFTWVASLIGILSSVAFFGWFTPLAFYANLVLVPLAILVISAGFASILLGLAGLAPLALVFNHAAALVLMVMQRALEWGLGGAASRTAEFVTSSWGQLGIVLVLATMVVVRERTKASSRWRWWGPPLVTVLVLVIGLRLT